MTRYTDAYLKRIIAARKPGYNDQERTAIAWLNDAAYPDRQAVKTGKEARMLPGARALRIHWRIWEEAVTVAYGIRVVSRYPDWYAFLADATGPGTSDGFTWAEYMLANEKLHGYGRRSRLVTERRI